MMIGKLELQWSGFSYGDESWPACYVHWWNWLPKKWGYRSVETGAYTEGKSLRYLGYEYCGYDGPNHSFGFWFFNVSWRMPWSRWK